MCDVDERVAEQQHDDGDDDGLVAVFAMRFRQFAKYVVRIAADDHGQRIAIQFALHTDLLFLLAGRTARISPSVLLSTRKSAYSSPAKLLPPDKVLPLSSAS